MSGFPIREKDGAAFVGMTSGSDWLIKYSWVVSYRCIYMFTVSIGGLFLLSAGILQHPGLLELA